MRHIDLSDVFDGCYESHRDFSTEISLRRENGKWRNDEVSFWKDEIYGWCFKHQNDHWNYGYDTLRGAVTSYLYGRCSKQAVDPGFCASRMLSNDYKQAGLELHCKVTNRYFRGEDGKQFSRTCDALTSAINAGLQGIAAPEPDEAQGDGMKMNL